ncbi:MAG: transposase [Prochlorotrichaceae cyanobacterium]|jgi:transcriptional regulator with XRE-family HTH domain
MAPAKLTEAEKETIFRLYRETDETTSTLSRQYGVSVSTISRLLKSKLPLEEYEDLVRLKRSGLSRSPDEPSFDGPEDASEDKEGLEEDKVDEAKSVASSPEQPLVDSSSADPILVGNDRRRRRRSSAQGDEEMEQSPEPPQQPSPQEISPQQISPQPTNQQLDLLALSSEVKVQDPSSFGRPILRKAAEPEPEPESDAEIAAEQSLEDDEDDYVYSFGDEEFGDDDEDDFEDDEADDETVELAPMLGKEIEIIPLSEADFPRVCYLVVDRTSELVTCRLQDFRELGQIPEAEAQHRTLPLFDNHRVARRFSRRNQRVIKLPDGRMLHKTARWLEAKGITRLLLDGKVYDLQGAKR